MIFRFKFCSELSNYYYIMKKPCLNCFYFGWLKLAIFWMRFLRIDQCLPVTESTFSHNSCQTSPTPPHNLPTWYVNEFLVDSKTKKAEPRTKMALKKAPFKVENNEVWFLSWFYLADATRQFHLTFRYYYIQIQILF